MKRKVCEKVIHISQTEPIDLLFIGTVAGDTQPIPAAEILQQLHSASSGTALKNSFSLKYCSKIRPSKEIPSAWKIRFHRISVQFFKGERPLLDLFPQAVVDPFKYREHCFCIRF